jgi:hypothetical protein
LLDSDPHEPQRRREGEAVLNLMRRAGVGTGEEWHSGGELAGGDTWISSSSRTPPSWPSSAPPSPPRVRVRQAETARQQAVGEVNRLRDAAIEA